MGAYIPKLHEATTLDSSKEFEAAYDEHRMPNLFQHKNDVIYNNSCGDHSLLDVV